MDVSPSPPVSSDIVISTWEERLLFTLLSYSLVLAPIAFVVLATRYNLCPTPLQNSALVSWFVYGQNRQSKPNRSGEDDHQVLLLDQGDNGEQKSANNTTVFKFLWCLLGLNLSYLVWGVLQEKIMTTEYQVTKIGSQQEDLDTKHLKSTISDKMIRFHDSQFLVFLNRIIAFILSIAMLVYNRPRQSQLYSGRYSHQPQQAKPQAPLYEYIYCALSSVLSSWCQYEALKYVNFPTQVLSKSCKIIPVMLMSKLLMSKKYPTFDYICALLLSLGMFIFTLNQPEDVKRHSLHDTNHVTNSFLAGLIILALYLILDSFTSNWQQSLFSRYGVSNWQMMSATNFYSILLTLTSLQQQNALQPAFKLLASSSSLLVDCVLMSIMSSIGQLFVYYTIKHFGSVTFAIIMTLRQFFAIILSCAIYGHRLTLGSIAGLLLVFFVVGFQMWRKSKGQQQQQSSKNSKTSKVVIQFKK